MTCEGRDICVVCPHVRRRAKKIAHRKRKKRGLLAAAKGIALITNEKLEKNGSGTDKRSLDGKASVEDIIIEDENDHEGSKVKDCNRRKTESKQCSHSIEEKLPNNMISVERSDEQPQREGHESLASESHVTDVPLNPEDHTRNTIYRSCEGNNATLSDTPHNTVVGIGSDSGRRSRLSKK